MFLEISNFIKKETLAQVFSCKFCENSKNVFFTEYLRATVSIKEIHSPDVEKMRGVKETLLLIYTVGTVQYFNLMLAKTGDSIVFTKG